MFPDVLGIRSRVQDVLLVEESADAAVGGLLLGWYGKEELFGEALESWCGEVFSMVVRWDFGVVCSRKDYLL